MTEALLPDLKIIPLIEPSQNQGEICAASVTRDSSHSSRPLI